MHVLSQSNTIDSVNEQREALLKLNYDKLYGVYELINDTPTSVDIHLVKHCLVTFKNQLDNLNGLKENPSITILDLNELSKGKAVAIGGPSVDFGDKKIIMCSGGMIDFFSPENFSGNGGHQHTHMITSLRDAGATSHNQRTTVAGRILGDDIRKNIDIESAEESPFLGLMNGKFHLAIGNSNFEYLKEAVKLFLETKYDPKNPELKKLFERGFRGLAYEELGDVLTDIIENNRILEYESEELTDIKGLEHLKKKVKIDNKEESFYVVFNPVLNTYEFKVIKRFKGFPKGFTIPGKRPNRLFLESYNQSPRLNRLENATKINPSGAIKVFSEEIVGNIEDILKSVE